MQKKLIITSSPHLRDGASTRRIMQEVCLALAPAGIASIILFGVAALKLIVASVLSCVIAEYLYAKLTNQKVPCADWSAVVTGLLLAYNLPSTVPIWIPVVGGIIAMVLCKAIFGGLGSNFMNPALTARAVLFVSWGSYMGSYPNTRFMTDTISSATPLANLANGQSVDLWNLFIGNVPGVLGETCKLALLLGGIYLIVRGIIDWKIPVCFIGTAFLLFLLKDGFTMALSQILSGAMILGAFFMATDYVTSPVSNLGRVIMGVGCGILIFVIRAFANYPEGCSFAILFMNVMTPMIDRFTVPKIFGEVKKHG
ncbi:MAG: RnfABCDGE type electron transport complex subunit D [Clostridia bacterium]|nr:RnfABCDGE type electron transport complex subunit D [Clostridia bacterium]MBR2288564.1 RnfABCDGE type electron transport complex subunit D [Clostridia bacterium]